MYNRHAFTRRYFNPERIFAYQFDGDAEKLLKDESYGIDVYNNFGNTEVPYFIKQAIEDKKIMIVDGVVTVTTENWDETTKRFTAKNMDLVTVSSGDYIAQWTDGTVYALSEQQFESLWKPFSRELLTELFMKWCEFDKGREEESKTKTKEDFMKEVKEIREELSKQ